MGLNINKKVWVIAERLYIRCHSASQFLTFLGENDINYNNNLYQKLNPSNVKDYYCFMSDENYDFASFMELIPTYKYLSILKKIIFDPDIEQTQHDDWNFYGEFIKEWYPSLIELLSLANVKIDTDQKTLTHEEIQYCISSDDFLSQENGDIFLDYIRKEINEANKSNCYLSVMFLARKLLECQIVRILEIVFPKIQNNEYSESNHNLWYNKQQSRYHSFDILLENLKDNACSFHEDKDLIKELVGFVKPFKNETNKCVHNDYKIPDESYIKQWRIPHTIGMARKLFKKYCNP